MTTKLKIAIVVGEASGDLLGVALMRSIRDLHPEVEFEGIGGPLMCEEGFNSLYPMERLSVMGFIEPLKRLPELLRIKAGLVSYFSENRPDIYVGIDSPDFNLRVERPLKEKGVNTIHYVSPSVWAWRQGRIKTIRKAIDMVLCLFPFETNFYRNNKVPVAFVGHPMADEIPLFEKPIDGKKNQKQIKAEIDYRKQLGIDSVVDYLESTNKNLATKKKYIALLPGSRLGEIEKMVPLFFDVADELHNENSEYHFLVPAASQKAYEKISEIQSGREYIDVFHGQTRPILAVSDAALVASGTATLEAMFMKCPMVVAYKVDAMTYQIAKRLVKVEHVSLVNLLADRAVLEERIQQEATTDILCSDLREVLKDSEKRKDQIDTFYELHAQLQIDASRIAANAILQLIRNNKKKTKAKAI